MFLLCSFVTFFSYILLPNSFKLVSIAVKEISLLLYVIFSLCFVSLVMPLMKLKNCTLCYWAGASVTMQRNFCFSNETSSMRRKWTNKRPYKSRKLNWTELIAEWYNCCPCYVSKQPKNRKTKLNKKKCTSLVKSERVSEQESYFRTIKYESKEENMKKFNLTCCIVRVMDKKHTYYADSLILLYLTGRVLFLWA